MSKVFVGNMSFDTTREQLEALFAPMGEITEIVVPTDRDSGRPRGFAFVTYASGESATQAIEKLNGVELGGRNLRVNEAMERASRPMGGGWYGRPFGGGGGGGRPADAPSRPKGSRRNVRAASAASGSDRHSLPSGDLPRRTHRIERRRGLRRSPCPSHPRETVSVRRGLAAAPGSVSRGGAALLDGPAGAG